MSRNVAQYEAGADVRFGLAYERLAAQDAATSAYLNRVCGIADGDEDAALDIRECVVCRGPVKRHWAKICSRCSARGWRPSPCPTCGGPVNIRDRAHKHYRPCAKCRAARRDSL